MDQQLTRMLKKARAGKVVLFLGAGASIAAGAPSSDELTRAIREEFLDGVVGSGDLIEAVSAALDTPGLDRAELEDFVRAKLDLQPSSAHLKIPLHSWQAILTTNYDDLVEAAYRAMRNRAQRCEPVFSSEFSRRQSDYVDLVRLFKLMGCVTGQSPDSRMALSRSDYNRKLRKRGSLFRLLYDFMKDGTVVYIGYSFRDKIGMDMLDEVADEVGLDRLPWGWALLPEWDGALEAQLRQRKVLPLKMTFEEFLEAVSAAPAISPSASAIGATVTVRDTQVDIPTADLKMYSRQFECVNDSTGVAEMPDSAASRRDYLEGKTNPWIGVVRGWAFRRPLVDQLRTEVERWLGRVDDKTVPVLCLTGPAGSGKSTVARMVAWEVYKDGGYPVILLHPETDQADYMVIDSFSRQLDSGVPDAVRSSRKLPLLIVIDDAAARVQDARRLPQYLASRGIPAVILVVARENEWTLAQGERPAKVTAGLSLSDRLDDDGIELVDLVHHLRKLEVLVSSQSDGYWVARASKEYEMSFSTTLYYLAEPTRPPLTEAIQNEYEHLSPIARRAYQHVCGFYQFGIPLDLELLARALGCSYADFVESVFDPASRGVLVEDDLGTGETTFRARSRKVAELVAQHAFGSPEAWLHDIRDVVGASLPHNIHEVQTIRSLLIHRIGPRGAERQEPIEAVQEVFEAAFSAGITDSAVLHHFALLLLDQGLFENAEDSARRALQVLDDPDARGHFKTESRQNLYNTLGMIAARHGISLEQQGESGAAGAKFSEAVACFHSARAGEYINAYPFYSESWMHLQRARDAVGEDALRHLAAAFQVLDESEGNVPDEDLPTVLEMEAKCVAFLSGIPEVQRKLEAMQARADGSATYLLARRAADDEAPTYDLQQAYKTLEAALEKDPKHPACLRLASRLYRKLAPEDVAGWKSLLERRYALEDRRGQCGLLFDLGCAACELGDYRGALRSFGELEAESIGHPKRSGIVAVVRDGGRDRRFTGLVTALRSRHEGWLRCSALGTEVKFIPVAQKFTVESGQSVTFSLGLNYRGFLGIELRPD